MKECPIDRLVFDEQCWPRLRRDEDRIAQLAALLADGIALPAVKIQQGSAVVLGGWHTVAAYQRLGRDAVPVEVVKVPDDERLLYAFREDAEAALPYTAEDVRSVALRLYKQRSNGKGANVAELARDLGRARQTVETWLKSLVEAEREQSDRQRQARAVAVHAFLAGGLAQRRVAVLLGVAIGTVFSDAKSGIAEHLTESRIVSEAQSLIHLALGRGATTAEMEAARDWLIGQTDPEHLERRERARVWGAIASEVRDIHERLAALALPESPADWAGCEQARSEIVQTIDPLLTYFGQLKARVQCSDQ